MPSEEDLEAAEIAYADSRLVAGEAMRVDGDDERAVEAALRPRTLAEVVDHAGHDAFVAWGWAPGADRISAPGSQQEFAAILAGWVDNGGACPTKDGVSDG